MSETLTGTKEALIVLRKVCIDFLLHEVAGVSQIADLLLKGILLVLSEDSFSVGIDVETRISVVSHEWKFRLNAIDHVSSAHLLLGSITGEIRTINFVCEV